MACARCPTSCFDDEVAGRRDITRPSTDGSSISKFADGKHTAVLLKGIPENVHEEFIEMFFENTKNFTDVKVYSVCIDRDDRTAIVKFKDKQAANAVLEKECIIMKRARVHIESYHPEQQTQDVTQSEDNRELPRVVLKDLPDDVDQDDIKMLLCSKKRAGNIAVVEIDYNKVDSLAVVTLGNQESLETLLAKSPLTIFGESIHVVLQPLEQPKIRVSRLPENVDYEDVELFFENGRRFGDIKPLDIEFNEGDHSAILTYDTKSSVTFVVNRGPFKMRGKQLMLRKLPIDETVGSDKIITGNEIDTSPTQLFVEDIPKDVDKEIIEMFFESKTFKSCEVIDVDFDEKDRNAVVRFAKPEDAQVVLESRPLCLRNQKLSIQIYIPKPLDTIMIKGPPDVVSENSLDMLELYFDNENRSGGYGIVENKTTFDSENNIAFVTYKDERVAERVVLRKNHYLRKKKLQVTLFRPNRSTKCQNLARDPQMKPSKTIRVRGMKKIRTRESVNWYFESKKRAGGGDIESRYTDEEDDDTVYITFNEENAAKAVADREHHTVNGVDLTVSLYSPSVQTTPSYTNKILIKGLNAKITESLLGLFLEAKANYTLVDGSLTYHAVRDDVALVTTEQDIDFDTLKRACRDKPLEESYLDVSSVQISNCILVSNISENATKDTIELYFENKRRSNGGSVSKVKMFKTQGYCLVYFNDYKNVDSVLSKEQMLDGNKVEVKRYIQCIARAEGDSVKRRFRFSESFTISVSKAKTKFLKSSHMAKTALREQMNMCNASLTWSKDTPSVELSCSLTTEVRDCILLASNWKECAEQNFNDFIDKISEQNMPVMLELLEKVTLKLSEVSLEQPEAAAVYLSKETGKITVVGMKHVADPLIERIGAIINLASDEFAKEKTWTRETITGLDQIQTRMLLADKFPTKIVETFPDVKVEINQGKNEIIIEGTYQDVNTVQLKMYEQKEKFCSLEFQFQKQVLCLYDISNKTVKEYIRKKMENNRIVAVWENTGSKLIVMSANKDTLDTAAKVVRESVLSKTISLSEANMSVLQTHSWEEKHCELIAKYRDKICLDTTYLGKLVIGTTDDIACEVEIAIQSFLRTHSILKETIQVPRNVYKLMKRYHESDIQRIASYLHSEQVRIFSKDDAHAFEISGTKDGMEQAKTQVEVFLRKVNKMKHEVRKPGLGDYLQTKKGSEITRSVESAFPCVISMNEDSDGNHDMGSENICVIASCTGYENRRMFVTVGDMSELNVDVIVNPSDDKIGLSGRLGKVLKMKGGLALERPCRDYIKNNGPLREGEVLVSPVGNLKAKHIIHVVGPAWKDGTHQEDEKLTEVVFKTMQLASMKNLKSLAMPAISCGVYGFPVEKGTSIIVAAVKNFFREEQYSSLTEIYLCDMKYGTVDAFTEALQNEWGAHNVEKHASKTQQRKPDDSDEDAEHLYETLPAKAGPDPYSFGNIRVTIKSGDITAEDADCIVNSSNEDLDFNKGKVSQALMKKCGKSLLEEANSKKVDMKKYEVVLTKAPHLKCRQIMHVVAKESPQDWKQIIVKCLERAKKKGFRSLAFPALGTGMSASVAAATAQIMVQATKEFAADGCGSLTDVRFVIFQKEMIDSFHGAIRKAKGLQGVGVGLPPPPKPSTRRFSKIEADKDAVLFTLWALNMNTITSAIQKLGSCIEREVSTKVFDDTVISRMNDKQLKAIKQKADENHVEYKLIGGVIQIVGVMQNVVNVTDDIYASLRDAAKIENAAMILKDIVQWYWIEQTEMEDELKPYEMMLNYQIEQAFKAQKDNFTYTDNGEEVVVDFKNCSEYCKSKPGEKDTIIRKDLIKEFSGEVPANWKAMKGNLLVYKLAPADKEYTDLFGRFHASSGGGYTIHSIKKVQNKSLWLQYEEKKKQLEGQNPAGTKNEQFLWHGTSEDTVDSVNAHGFNRSYCGKNATAFGDGVYFAVNANYSCSDTYSRPGAQGLKTMYYCAVLTGEFILGKSGMRVQPPKTNAGKNALYDSVVNNVAGPAMYIIFNDTQAYPLYIITFKKQ